MKKLISSLLVLVTLLTAAVPVLAAADTTELEKIIVSVKERIGNMEEYGDFSANERQGTDGKVSYSLRWSDNTDGFKSAYVNVASDGVITSYSRSEEYHGDTGARIRSMDRKTAMEKAQTLVRKLNPMLGEELVLTDYNTSESLWDSGFSFEVQRVVNSVPVPECSGNVSVDENAENITYFYINHYQDAEFEGVENIIPADDAKSAFMERIGLEMEYYKEYSEEETKAMPVYVFGDTETKISATDGNGFIPEKSYGGTVYRTEDATADKEALVMNSSASAGGGASLSKTELTEMEKLSGLISKEEGAKLIFENPYIAIDGTTPLMNYNVYKYEEDKYRGSFYFGEEYSHVALDMKSGEVQYFFISQKGDEEEKNLTDEQAEALAIDGVKHLAGAKFDEYKKDENSTSYTRYANSIPFRQDRINVSVNPKLGIITSYSIVYNTCEFAELDGVLTEAQAGEKLFEELSYEPVYERNVQENKTVFKLIYDFDRSSIRMDAFTGNIENIYGEEKVFEGYTDISGHYAEDVINTLAKYGIHTEGSEFTPDKQITQSDYAKLLSCIVRRFDNILLKSATDENSVWMINEGIIDKELYNSDAPLTRLDAAKLLIRTIGAEEYAKLEGIYKSPFADVTDGIGYVSILYGMGVFKGDGTGNFNPQRNITYAEAAVIIYNYLTR